MEHEGDGNTNCNWCTRHNHKMIGEETRRLGNWKTSGDLPNYSIIKIDQNTEKSPGDLKRLAVNQFPLEDQLSVVWKILKGV